MEVDMSSLTKSQLNSIKYLGYKPVVAMGWAMGAARSKNGAAIVVKRMAEMCINDPSFTAANVAEDEKYFYV